jgi:tRNA pseudouridine55 synthase
MFILIDKPKGVTSHDVVDRLRSITGEKRIGHAGTLDPNASGLLILGIGKTSTKKLSIFLKLDKEYDAEIFLGEERETDDAEGKIRNLKLQIVDKISENEIKMILEKFIGEQMQTPPSYSAIKVKGKKAYEIARKGNNPELIPRKIVIYKIKLLHYKFSVLTIRTRVSSGTYIRSLARDIGRDLGCGAYLLNLRRIKIGNYNVKDSIKLEDLTSDNIVNCIFNYHKRH